MSPELINGKLFEQLQWIIRCIISSLIPINALSTNRHTKTWTTMFTILLTFPPNGLNNTSTLAWIMACHRKTPYLNQWWPSPLSAARVTRWGLHIEYKSCSLACSNIYCWYIACNSQPQLKIILCWSLMIFSNSNSVNKRQWSGLFRLLFINHQVLLQSPMPMMFSQQMIKIWKQSTFIISCYNLRLNICIWNTNTYFDIIGTMRK